MRAAPTISGVLLTLVALFPFASSPQNQPNSALSTPEEIQSEFKSVPCKRQDRLPAARALFERMGAKPGEMTTEKSGNAENLIVRRGASGTDTIVFGAHYDFIGGGCGAVDNWSGIVTLAHLYRSTAKFAARKNLIFVAFDREEEGLVGSRAIARAIKKEEISQYCAMINIDSFGLAGPFALSNTSSPPLVRLSEQTAATLQVPFYAVSIDHANTDSSSFLDRGIPAVTLSGLSKDWESILHSSKDQADKIQPASVYMGYRLALSIWARIDESPCDAYRDARK